jgi:hypothetical protein
MSVSTPDVGKILNPLEAVNFVADFVQKPTATTFFTKEPGMAFAQSFLPQPKPVVAPNYALGQQYTQQFISQVGPQGDLQSRNGYFGPNSINTPTGPGVDTAAVNALKNAVLTRAGYIQGRLQQPGRESTISFIGTRGYL